MATVDRLRRLAAERGAELIEFALVFPLLLAVVLGIIDFGFLFRNYEIVTNAAREGARIAILSGYDDDDVDARVSQYLTAGGLSGGSGIRIVPYSVNVGGVCMTLTGATATYPHTFLFVGPIVRYIGGGGSFTTRTLSATATMRYEGPALPC